MISLRDRLRHQWFSGVGDFAPVGSVFFLLLIFLLLQSHLAPVPGVLVELPSVETVSPIPGPDSQTVVVDREGRLFFRQQLTSDEALARQLAEHVARSSEQALLVIQADRDLNLGRLAEVYALCRRAGVSRLKLQTRPVLGIPSNTARVP